MSSNEIFRVQTPVLPVPIATNRAHDPLDLLPDDEVELTPLAGALRTAALGIPVAPLTAGQKFPPITGFPELATIDESQILAWASERRWENCNWIAVAKTDGVCFIDEDDSAAIRSSYEQKFGEPFPRTRTTESQPGHRQSYWRQTDRTRKFGNKVQGAFKNGVLSFRQDDLYVLAELSHLTPDAKKGTGHRDYVIVDDAPIAVMPDRVMDFLESLQVPASEKITAERLANEPDLMISEHFRNDTLTSIAGALRAKGLTQDEFKPVVERWNEERCVPQLPQDEIDNICRSVARYLPGNPVQSVLFGGKPAAGNPGFAALGAKAAQYTPLEFKYPAVSGSPFDFVIAAPDGSREGWFPLGDPSLVGGPSGSNKTTFMVDLLETQGKKSEFLGHKTFGLPYLVLMADRGENASIRTASRMHFDPQTIPTGYLPSVWNDAALHAILDEIEKCPVIPSIVFVEGCDMLVDNASKMEVVSPFLEGLQKIAKHYHIAIIGSVGSPKTRIGEGYASSRDKIFGTVAWSRKTETIALLQYIDGDDTDCRRSLAVLLRNGPAEKFDLKMEDGRLTVVTQDDKKENATPSHLLWFQIQGDWFTATDLQNALHLSKSNAYRLVQDAHAKRILKTKKKVVGASRLYKWNDERDTNRGRDDDQAESEQ